MAKGYWVVFADVTDPEGYKGYMAANAKALAKYGGRFLARGGSRAEGRQAKIARGRRGVPELQRGAGMLHVARIRLRRSVWDMAITEGYEGPQPQSN